MVLNIQGKETYKTLPGGNTNAGIGGNDLWSSAEAGHQEESEIKLQREAGDRKHEATI